MIVVTVETSGIPDPTISASNVNIAYNAASGSITYTINNEPSPAGTLTAAVKEGNWLTLGQGTTSPISFTCTANETTIARRDTVTLTYTYNTDQTVTANVVVTQTAIPYTTIPVMFAAATATETPAYVTFNNWVVSGVSTNGKNVFVTDNAGNGFVIYYGSDMSETYSAGKVLSGTEVYCDLKSYNGFAELLNVTATDLTITNGGTVNEISTIAMNSLSGVNTGALVFYTNLTCSVENNKYYLSDGDTTLQVYNSLYAFDTDALEDGKTYNIKGVYQQYNTTMEILPRSAEDIVEVTITTPSISIDSDSFELSAEAQEGYLEITYANLPITNASDFAIQYCNSEGTELVSGSEPDWIILYGDTQTGETGYFVHYEVDANNDVARTAYFKVYAMDDGANLVYSNLVTVTQAAYVAPPTPGNWVLTPLAELTPADVFVIVGTKESNHYAMSNDNGTSAPSVVGVTVVSSTLSGEIASNIQWNLSVSSNGYMFYPAGSNNTYLYCTNTNNGVKVGTGDAKHFTLSDNGYLTTTETNDQRYIGIYNTQDWRCYTSTTGTSNIKDQTFSFYKKVSPVVTYKKDISGYNGADGGYYLIASPVASVAPADTNGFITTTYDLYAFDQNEAEEWRNFEDASHPFTTLESGKGYLYASNSTTQLSFSGQPYNGNGLFELTYNDTARWAGYNLIGNPYNAAKTLNKAYYRMKPDGTEVIAGSGNVNPMEGVFVVVTEEGQTAIFTEPVSQSNHNNLYVNLNQVVNTRGNSHYSLVDRVILGFGESDVLPKFMLNPDNTKLYIPKDGKDYAVVRSEAQGELPVNFKAAENGTYTIGIETENLDVEYLHLIDNLTGTDVDLLATPSYSFEARKNDYASRFRLVFSANAGNNEVEDDFAFISDGNIVIANNGEATLQVIDVLGRVVSSQSINGSAHINANTPGVYVLQLINGTNVKTQKIVVK